MHASTDFICLNGYDVSLDAFQDYIDCSLENAIVRIVTPDVTLDASVRTIELSNVNANETNTADEFLDALRALEEYYDETQRCFNVELEQEKPNFYNEKNEKTARVRERKRVLARSYNGSFMRKLSNTARTNQRRKLNKLIAHGNPDESDETDMSRAIVRARTHVKKTNKLKTQKRTKSVMF